MTNRDVYTGAAIVTPSEEHVIPNFLGGPIVCRGILDKTTNDTFGHGIDATLFGALKPFIVLLDGRSDRQHNMPPRPLKGVSGGDGRRYDVGAGGAVEVQPSVSIEDLGGRARISATGSNERLIQQALSRWAKRTGRNPEAVVRQAFAMASVVTTPTPELTFDVRLFQPDCYRAIGKIACNLLAYRFAEVLLRPEFDQIRAWVLQGNTTATRPVCITVVDDRMAGFGELDHLVRVTTTASGRVEGTVILLGTMAFNVDLGATPDGMTFAHSLRVDQLGRQHRIDHQDDIDLAVEPFELATQRDFNAFSSLAAAQTNTLVGKVMRKVDRAWIRQTVQECFESSGVKPGEALSSDQQREAFARSVAERITAGLMPRIERAFKQMNPTAHGQPDGDDDDESA